MNKIELLDLPEFPATDWSINFYLSAEAEFSPFYIDHEFVLMLFFSRGC